MATILSGNLNDVPTCQQDFPQNFPQSSGQGFQQARINLYLQGHQAIDSFINKIEEAGLGRPDIVADGALHRFSTLNDNRGKKSGWYVLFMDNIPAGQFGSWKDDISVSFFALKENASQSVYFSQSEKRAFELAMEKVKELRKQEQIKLHDTSAVCACELWNKAEVVKETTEHQYLTQKCVRPFGLRLSNKQLLVPLINRPMSNGGEIRNLQRIYPNGDKKFLYGGEIKGLFHYIEGDTNTVYICEGYATGASLHMATGSAVVVAFNANNLLEVAKNVKIGMSQLPYLAHLPHIIIAGDNDAFTQKKGIAWNVGLEKAHQAAQEIGADFVFPYFKNTDTKPTDFNDLHQLEGLEAVKKQVFVSASGVRIMDWGVELFSGDASPTKWLVKDTLPMSAPCLLAASGGTGKGMLSLDLGLSVADMNEQVEMRGLFSPALLSISVSPKMDITETASRPSDSCPPRQTEPLCCLSPYSLVPHERERQAALRVAAPIIEQHCRGSGASCPREKEKRKKWLGSDVVDHGAVVILTAEDSKESIHQRLAGLDPDGSRRKAAEGRLFIVPLPNAGGSMQLVTGLGYGKGYTITPAFESLKKQLMRIPNLKLINIDPLSAFVGVDVNADPQAGQFVQGILAMLAEETGACVLVAHHLSKIPTKSGKTEWNADTARNAIRGTTALVDGVRLAIAVWPAGEERIKKVESSLNLRKMTGMTSTGSMGAVESTGTATGTASMTGKKHSIFEAAVVKANSPANMETRVLLRAENGLLESIDTELNSSFVHIGTALWHMEQAIKDAAERGAPFTKTGVAGLYNRRHELHKEIQDYGKEKKFRMLVDTLLESGKIVVSTYGKGIGRYLDVPSGQFAEGTGIIEAGSTSAENNKKVFHI